MTVKKNKFIVIIFFCVFYSLTGYSQKNSIKGFTIGMYTPAAGFGIVSISYERYLNENNSLNINIRKFGGGISANSFTNNSCLLYYRYYKNTNHFEKIKNWISPHIGINYSKSSGGENTDWYKKTILSNFGFTIGQRYQNPNKKIFFDVGVGITYGYNHYIEYYKHEFYTDKPPITKKDDEYIYYPRLLLNFGYKF